MTDSFRSRTHFIPAQDVPIHPTTSSTVTAAPPHFTVLRILGWGFTPRAYHRFGPSLWCSLVPLWALCSCLCPRSRGPCRPRVTAGVLYQNPVTPRNCPSL